MDSAACPVTGSRLPRRSLTCSILLIVAALLNNQPMGFYDPATIVGDAASTGRGSSRPT